MKNDTTKTTRKKMKAPGSEEEDHVRPKSSRPDKDLEFVYRHQALRDFLYQDPVMRILQPKQIEDPQRPVRAPMQTSHKLTAVKDLLSLLTDAGIVSPYILDSNDQARLAARYTSPFTITQLPSGLYLCGVITVCRITPAHLQIMLPIVHHGSWIADRRLWIMDRKS
ncbi:hypothetical protein PI125_g6995 [Phytophthora idaei]|nr:hypothetical protein PI125_g6995 [Phytophthora idaei]